MNAKARHIISSNGVSPHLVVQLEDGRMFALHGSVGADAHWVRIPDFPAYCPPRVEYGLPVDTCG